MADAKDWLEEIKGDASWRSVAKVVEIPTATLNRQVKDGSIQPRTIVKIARYFNESPIGGLTALGLLTERDVAQMQVSLALRAASDDDIVKEVLRRIKANPESELNKPVSDTQVNHP